MITARFLEQAPHTTKPHFLQWCLRCVRLKLPEQRMQAEEARSGIQETAKVEPGVSLLLCSSLDRHSSM